MNTDIFVGKKILWVEDDPFLSDILIRKFADYQCKLFLAKNAEEAAVLIEQEHPDVMLLDVILPGTNGFDFLGKIRTTPFGRTLPVIFLSNLGQEGDIHKAEMLGAKKFLVKAVSTLDQIVAEIRDALSQKTAS